MSVTPDIEPRFLCILASARTGSTYVWSVLWHIEGVRSKTEIFHWQQAFSMTPAEVAAVGAAARRGFEGAADPDLVAWMREYPIEAIDAMATEPSEPPAELFSFKIFPDQLPIGTIRSRFFGMPRMRFLMIKRRIIDTYISVSKARLLRQYVDVDTTGIRVTLDAAAFVRYVEHQRRWYDTLSAELTNAGKSCPVLRYEEFSAVSPQHFARTLATMLEGMGCRGLRPAAENPTYLPFKQDRSASYEEKVTNWAEFLDDPLVRGLNTDIFGHF